MSTDRTDPVLNVTMSSRSDLEARIVEVLCDQGERHVLEVAAEVGEHPVTVERACRRLHRNGALVSVSVGVFRCRDDTNRF